MYDNRTQLLALLYHMYRKPGGRGGSINFGPAIELKVWDENSFVGGCSDTQDKGPYYSLVVVKHFF